MKNNYGGYYLSEKDKEYRRKGIAPISVWEKKDIEKKIGALNKFSDEEIETFMKYSLECVKKVFLRCYAFDENSGMKYYYFYPLFYKDFYTYEYVTELLSNKKKELAEERKAKRNEPVAIQKIEAIFEEWNSWTNRFDEYAYTGYKKSGHNWMYSNPECTDNRKKLFTKHFKGLTVLEGEGE